MSLLAAVTIVGTECVRKAGTHPVTLFLVVALLWWVVFTLQALGLGGKGRRGGRR